ncbi:MAG TPA: AAA family ATPase [Chloroflexi bacterium]|nr:AAA family ATPase [Chloroflexota bacterium]
MCSEYRDPWVDVRTYHGLPADQVISALQKEIRRGNTENAALLAYEMVITSPALEDYLWYRLMVISVEDIGFGEPQAPVLINALYQMLSTFDRGAGERKLFAVHAVRYLCGCQKDRSSDEMVIWMSHAVESGEIRPQIPDYALDMHTAKGQEMGRGRRHFFEEGARLNPELPDRDRTYHERIMKMLEQGELD